MTITAAADGSSLSNPGPSGWAWYIDDDRWHAGGWPHGTNNMGELMAVLDLLRETAGTDEELQILCDSQYVINSVTKWMPGWKRNGWKKSDKKPVLNVELLKELDAALQGRNVRFEWVKGHAGHELNEAADNRARAAATAYRDGTKVLTGPGFSTKPPRTEQDSKREPTTAPVDAPTGATSTATAAPQASAAPMHVTQADLADVVAREQAMLSDEVRSSADRSGELLHPEFAEIGSSGRVWTRDEMLADLAPLPSPVTLEVIDCSAVGPDAVLLLWRATGRGWTVNRSSLWLRTPAGWQLRFHQGTRA